jgi:geranyl-CoA carboxylase alpha subunit
MTHTALTAPRSIRRILIANRGEIARRIIRSAHAMGIETVAVYSDADAMGLPVREATMACALGGNASSDTYLNIAKIVAAAKHSGADAVHPGYGFLSENAVFAQAVLDAGLAWIGPPPAAIHAVGSKAGAKQLAQACGVPCLPGYFGADQSDATLTKQALELGTPLMVKASAGGGGRGMRLVLQQEQFTQALHSARTEALAAFGSSDVVLERALLAPRHVEVQIFADAHGHCIHLGERDCSAQRRHQKIIEESPSPGLSEALRAQICDSAVKLALAVGYVGAGTVEFLVEGDSSADRPPLGARAPSGGSAAHAVASVGASFSADRPPLGARAPSGGSAAHAVASVGANYYLMEMNTRLQVEHPVTELRTGLDLVEWQIRIARGEPLPLQQAQVKLQGHAIEVRLCAEDAAFVPHTGRVARFVPPTGAVRFDHALFEGLRVSPHYDSMLGKMIVHAATRLDAIDVMQTALNQCVVLGLPTNRRFLWHCLQQAEFRAGDADIAFLSRHADEIRSSLLKEELLPHYSIGLRAIYASKSAYALPCPFERPVRLRQAGVLHDAALQNLPPSDGTFSAQTAQRRWHVQQGGIDLWVEDASFDPPQHAGSATQALELRAPMNGKVLTITVQAGSAVHKGDVLLTIESMKLEHAITAPCNAVVEAVQVSPGQQIGPQQVLLRFAAEGSA